MIHRTKIYSGLFASLVFVGLLLARFNITGAASLTYATDKLSSPVVGAYSDHTIAFRSVSGLSEGTIVLDMSGAVSSLNALTYEDIDLMHMGTQVRLASTPGVGVWGVSVNATDKKITFSYPLSGGTAIRPGAMVVVRIGKAATYQQAGALRPLNASTAGAKTISLAAGPDSGTASVLLQAATPSNTQMINGLEGNSLPVIVSSGSDNGTLAVSLVANDSIGVGATRLNLNYVIGGIFPPTEIRGAAISEGVIEVTWKDNSQIERGYVLERRQVKEGVETTFDPIALLDISSTRYQDTNLPSELTFTYRVRAYNETNFSAYATSHEISTLKIAVPLAPLSGFIPSLQKLIVRPREANVTQTPTAPKSQPVIRAPDNVLDLVGKSEASAASLTWIVAGDPDVLLTQVQWSDTGFPQTPSDGVTVFKQMGTSFHDSNLANGAPSYYTVFTVNKYGMYSSGAFVSVTPQGPPVVARPLPQQEIVQSAPAFAPSTPSQDAPVSPAQTAPLSAVQITLSPEVSKTFAAQEQGVVQVTNKGSDGSTSALSVLVEPRTLEQAYNVSVSPYSLEQVKEMDATISLPAEKVVAGSSFYQVQLKRADQPVKVFQKPLVLRFAYARELLGGIDERSLKVSYWDSHLSNWVGLPSRVDTEHGFVETEVRHTTLFTLFADKPKGPTRQVSVVSQTVVRKPQVVSALKPVALFDVTSFIKINGRELTAPAGSQMQLCLSQSLFTRPVNSLAVRIGESNYFLIYDYGKKCYVSNIITPLKTGTYPLQVKVVYADDYAQASDFSLHVTPQERKAGMTVLPSLEQAPIAFPLEVAFLIIVLFLAFFIDIFFARRFYRKIRR